MALTTAAPIGRNNPQTWTRLKRIELRELANDIGNEAVLLHEKWPTTGEGRDIKATTERISKQLGGHQQSRTLKEAFAELESAAAGLSSILANRFFQQEMAAKPIRRRKRDRSAMGTLINATSADTLKFIREYVFPVEPEPDVTEQLESVIPPQQLGPVYFEFSRGQLRVRHQSAAADDADKNNVDAAARAVEQLGSRIADKLQESNYDHRIVDTIHNMVARVKSRQDIIELGIANIAAQLVFDASKDEIADVLNAELQAFGVALSMYVAQFPQWARFSENAAMAEYTSSDVTNVFQAGRNLAHELESAADAVDPEIPHTLRWMLEAIRYPRLAVKRTVFAAIRTIENLISVVLTTFSEILGSAKDGVKKGTKTAVGTVVATALLLAAANAASGVFPSAAKFAQTAWLGKAAEIVLKKLGVE